MQLGEESGHVPQTGKQITERREALHMTMAQLAEEAGVDPDTLSSWEHEVRRPRSTTVAAVMKALSRIEAEAGPLHVAPSRDTDPHVVTIRGTRGGDIDVVVSGPIGDIDKLAETVERLLRSTRGSDDQPQDD